MSCGIYKITSPTGKIYIGQSVNIERRWSAHRKNKKTSNIISRSIAKHGHENHKWEIIEKCIEADLNKKEKYYVDLFKTFNSKCGMNCRDGGGSRGKFSDEVKLKLSLSHLGNVNSSETRMKISKALKNRRHSEEHNRKVGLANKGRVVSKEHRISISKKLKELYKDKTKHPMYGKRTTPWNKGKKMNGHTEQHKIKISIGMQGKNIWSKGRKLSSSHILKLSKPVIQLDEFGEKINEFNSTSEAKNITGICNITSALKGNRKQAGGFIWRYKNG